MNQRSIHISSTTPVTVAALLCKRVKKSLQKSTDMYHFPGKVFTGGIRKAVLSLYDICATWTSATPHILFSRKVISPRPMRNGFPWSCREDINMED